MPSSCQMQPAIQVGLSAFLLPQKTLKHSWLSACQRTVKYANYPESLQGSSGDK